MRGLRYKIKNPKEAARANAILGSDSFVVWVKENFLSEIGFLSKDFSHLKTIRTPIPIQEIAEEVAEEYGLKAGEIIKEHSPHREGRLVLLEICYRLNLRKMSTRQMGIELGGVSGEQVSQVHKVMRERIKQERKLAKRVEKILFRFHT